MRGSKIISLLWVQTILTIGMYFSLATFCDQDVQGQVLSTSANIESTQRSDKQKTPSEKTPNDIHTSPTNRQNKILTEESWGKWAIGNNLIAGKVAKYHPQPNYKLTKEGDSDLYDLTDGDFVDPKQKKLWFSKKAVGWAHTAGDIYIVFDIGGDANIGSAVVRLQIGHYPGTTGNAGPSLTPERIDFLVSNDGKKFHVAASFKRYHEGMDKNSAFVYDLDKEETYPQAFHIDALNVRARYAAFRILSAGAVYIDEIAVLEGTDTHVSLNELPTRNIIVNNGAAISFWDEEIIVPTNIYLPAHFRVSHQKLAANKQKVTYKFEVPDYIDIPKKNFWSYLKQKESLSPLKGYKIVSFTKTATAGNRSDQFNLFIKSKAETEGKTGNMRIWAEWDNGKQEPISIPLQTVLVKKPRMDKRFMTTSWLGYANMRDWPGFLDAHEALGFNTVMGDPRNLQRTGTNIMEVARFQNFLDTAKSRGFDLALQDSPLHYITHPENNKDYDEALHIRPDGSVIKGRKNLCHVYFGKLYEKEMKRISNAVKLFDNRIDYIFWDCEINILPKDLIRCKRCADYAVNNGLDFSSFSKKIWVKRHLDFYNAAMESIYELGYNEKPPYFLEYGVNLSHGRLKSLPVEGFKELYPKILVGNPKLYGDGNTAGDLENARALILKDFTIDERMINIPYVQIGATGYYPEKRVRDLLAFLIGAGCRGLIYWGNRYAHTPSRLLYHRDAVDAFRGMTDITREGDFFLNKHNDYYIFGRRIGDEGVVIVYVPYNNKDNMKISSKELQGKFVFDLFTDKIIAYGHQIKGDVDLDFSDEFWVKALYFSTNKDSFRERRK